MSGAVGRSANCDGPRVGQNIRRQISRSGHPHASCPVCHRNSMRGIAVLCLGPAQLRARRERYFEAALAPAMNTPASESWRGSRMLSVASRLRKVRSAIWPTTSDSPHREIFRGSSGSTPGYHPSASERECARSLRRCSSRAPSANVCFFRAWRATKKVMSVLTSKAYFATIPNCRLPGSAPRARGAAVWDSQ
jgi:hypothetical protein